MVGKRWLWFAAVGMGLFWGGQSQARDLKITLPKHSDFTPVQRLNREGVDAVRKHQYEKAKSLFYKAYLFDPNDPFTLNNLGYISELEGQVERAQRFYSLASQEGTDAIIERASLPQMEGKSFQNAISSIHDVPMQINRNNVEAVRLLSQGRAPEADVLLQRTLALDARNAFTLNNMGVAKEMEGDLGEALKYYTAVADSHSDEPVMVTVTPAWRGKPVTEMAAASARKVRERLHRPESSEAKAAELNLRGVSALNRNDWREASQDFEQAYKLDPNSAFSLNNLGYVAEMQGDRETAEMFYEKARKAERANVRVGLASRRSAEGMKLVEVADDSDQKVETQIEKDREAKRQQGGPIELKRRDNKPIDEIPPAPQSDNPSPNGVPRPPQSDNQPVNQVPRPPQLR